MKTTLIFFLTSLSLISQAQSVIVWDNPKTISSNSGGYQHPRIALNGKGKPVVIFGTADKEQAYVTYDMGSMFSSPIPVATSGRKMFAASWAGPDIAAKGDTVYLIYKQAPEVDANNHIWLRKSTDGGATFSSEIQVDQIGDSVSRFPTLTTDAKGNPIVAFMKFDPSFGDARWVVSRSTDLGASFTSDVLASKFSGGNVCDCCPGGITSNGSTVVMMYRDAINNLRDSWNAVSTDSAKSFSVGFNADNHNWNLNACPSTGPDGFIYNDSIYSIFMNGSSGKGTIYWNKTALDGQNAGQSLPILEDMTGVTLQNYPRFDARGSRAAAVWKQAKANKFEIMLGFTENLNAGNLWEPFIVASESEDFLINADVAVGFGEIHVVWEDNYTNSIKYRRGTVAVTGVKSVEAPDFIHIYPNPVSDFLTIRQDKHQFQKIAILNLQGQVIIQKELAKNDQVDLRHLPNGIYFLQSMDTWHRDSGIPFIVQH